MQIKQPFFDKICFYIVAKHSFTIYVYFILIKKMKKLMADYLNNRKNRALLYHNLKDADKLIQTLDQKHPLERKIQFFLDIRGIISVNHIQGVYIEYGCFRCETMFLAERILKSTNAMKQYIGLDIFDSSKLELTDEDLSHNTYDYNNKFKVNNLDIKDIFTDPSKISLVKGDLRETKTMDQIDFKNEKINVAIIDSNFISSLKTSIDHCLDNIVNAGFVFIDDYFTNLENGVPIIHEYFINALKKRNLKAIDYKIYPPFAKSFMVFSSN